ncbi:YtxH domain-containing protein [Pedobacter sandarakinus]|uniref:YtxH domain-containing protein n=1 Tax=Pedobacter sandarakinus TaxID=353156 RepID=UPI00224648B3|nr:YtxH domain-containing protein [Pedobacter sandarakinus]MCX2574917.1 YtxH domain-containing protein [Pedobacter sandarakinus]
MGLLKTALIGAAVYAGFKYVTKKDQITGKSVIDDLKDKAPEWKEKTKGFQRDLEGRMSAAESDLTR